MWGKLCLSRVWAGESRLRVIDLNVAELGVIRLICLKSFLVAPRGEGERLKVENN